VLRVLNRHGAGWLLRRAGMVRLIADRTFSYMPYTALFNVTGQPAMSVPLHWSAAGLPIGMQFVARFGDEATLLRLGGQLERARPWAQRRPPMLSGEGEQPRQALSPQQPRQCEPALRC